MFSVSLPNVRCCSPQALPTFSPNTQLTKFSLLLPSGSSNSQLFGLRLSVAATNAFAPANSDRKSVRNPICAKVSKGDVPPSFMLTDQDHKAVSLSSFIGKPLVLYFYPADESPGCTREKYTAGVVVFVQSLFDDICTEPRDSYEKFKKAGAEVIGISSDGPASHKAFAKKYRLPFTLLSDEGNKVRKEWGVPSDLFGALPGRETYVIDKKGVVQLVYNNQFEPEKHVDETLKLLQNL